MKAKIKNFLEKNKAKYELFEHRKVFTVYDSAATQGVEPKQIAKTLLMKADSRDYVLAVVPGNKNLDLPKLKKAINAERKKRQKDGPKIKLAKKIGFATEKMIKKLVGREGVLLPFGSLYKLPTFVDKSLLKQKKIIMSAGDFTESLDMTSAQYKKLEKPLEASFAKARKK